MFLDDSTTLTHIGNGEKSLRCTPTGNNIGPRFMLENRSNEMKGVTVHSQKIVKFLSNVPVELGQVKFKRFVRRLTEQLC